MAPSKAKSSIFTQMLLFFHAPARYIRLLTSVVTPAMAKKP